MDDSPARDRFERIYRRHVADVYRFALAVLRNPVEAEDVTQTTVLNAYRAYERGERPHRVNSWLIVASPQLVEPFHGPFPVATSSWPFAGSTIAPARPQIAESLPPHERGSSSPRRFEQSEFHTCRS